MRGALEKTQALLHTWWPKGRRVWRLYAHRAGLRLHLIPPHGPRVVANSIPKAGSHLLLRCLEHMPSLVYTRQHVDWHTPLADLERLCQHLQPGEFFTAHLPFTPDAAERLRAHDIKMVLIVRDPRDVVVSHVYWVTYRYTRGRFHPFFRSLPDDHARLMASIRGTPPLPTGDRLPDIGTRFRAFLAWAEWGAHLVRFEDLIGAAGGGSDAAQVRAILDMARYLGLSLTPQDAAALARRLYNPHSPTFRRGRVGDWKRHFTEEHKAALKEVAGDLLIALGYEHDTDW